MDRDSAFQKRLDAELRLQRQWEQDRRLLGGLDTHRRILREFDQRRQILKVLTDSSGVIALREAMNATNAAVTWTSCLLILGVP